MAEQIKVFLNEDEIPRQWYNIQADLPHPLPPPLGPNGKPVSPDMLAPVFPMNLVEQEVSQQRWIDIPEPVLQKLLIWRPILAGKCRLEEVKSGVYTLVDLQKLNALLDMQNDIQQQAIDDAKKDQKKGGE